MAAEVRDLLENRTTLLAGISHDLRTPMTRLQLNLELLRSEFDSAPDKNGAPGPARIDRAVADLAEMNQLIAAYLELARTSQAEAKVRFDLAELLHEVADAAGLDGSGAASCEIVAGRLALRQILTNLIHNAQRHGGGTPVELVLECTDRQARVSVRDSGPGIPDDQLEKVFRPFYRLEASRSQDTGGTGLGLAIVRQLAQTNGWKVKLTNRATGGLEARLEIRR
jgi:two-component system osmolarity sensor histidine kinase EnvZ